MATSPTSVDEEEVMMNFAFIESLEKALMKTGCLRMTRRRKVVKNKVVRDFTAGKVFGDGTKGAQVELKDFAQLSKSHSKVVELYPAVTVLSQEYRTKRGDDDDDQSDTDEKEEKDGDVVTDIPAPDIGQTIEHPNIFLQNYFNPPKNLSLPHGKTPDATINQNEKKSSSKDESNSDTPADLIIGTLNLMCLDDFSDDDDTDDSGLARNRRRLKKRCSGKKYDRDGSKKRRKKKKRHCRHRHHHHCHRRRHHKRHHRPKQEDEQQKEVTVEEGKIKQESSDHAQSTSSSAGSRLRGPPSDVSTSSGVSSADAISVGQRSSPSSSSSSTSPLDEETSDYQRSTPSPRDQGDVMAEDCMLKDLGFADDEVVLESPNSVNSPPLGFSAKSFYNLADNDAADKIYISRSPKRAKEEPQHDSDRDDLCISPVDQCNKETKEAQAPLVIIEDDEPEDDDKEEEEEDDPSISDADKVCKFSVMAAISNNRLSVEDRLALIRDPKIMRSRVEVRLEKMSKKKIMKMKRKEKKRKRKREKREESDCAKAIAGRKRSRPSEDASLILKAERENRENMSHWFAKRTCIAPQLRPQTSVYQPSLLKNGPIIRPAVLNVAALNRINNSSRQNDHNKEKKSSISTTKISLTSKPNVTRSAAPSSVFVPRVKSKSPYFFGFTEDLESVPEDLMFSDDDEDLKDEKTVPLQVDTENNNSVSIPTASVQPPVMKCFQPKLLSPKDDLRKGNVQGVPIVSPPRAKGFVKSETASSNPSSASSVLTTTTTTTSAVLPIISKTSPNLAKDVDNQEDVKKNNPTNNVIESLLLPPLSSRSSSPQEPTKIRFPAVQRSRNMIECKWKNCQMAFTTHGQLSDHLKAIHVIGQISNSSRTKTSSKLSVSPEESFECLWQGCKVYAKRSCSRSWLEKHVPTHGGKFAFACIVSGCKQRFSSQKHLQRHVNNHFAEENQSSNVSSTTCISCNSGSSSSPSSSASSTISGSTDSSTSRLGSLARLISRKSVGGGLESKRNLKKAGVRLKYRRTVFSARIFDYFDASVMPELRSELRQLVDAHAKMEIGANDTMTFTAKPAGFRTGPSGVREALVKWTPEDLLDDEWIPVSEISPTKTVKLSELSPSAKSKLEPVFFPAKKDVKRRRK